jgi:hypothetical protein
VTTSALQIPDGADQFAVIALSSVGRRRAGILVKEEFDDAAP